MQGLKSVIKTNDTTIVLSASDFLSEDFCGGLSAYLDCPYFPNCVSLQTDNSGISVIKPIYNSSVYEQLSITKFPAIISLSSIAPYSETLKKRKGRIKAITIENTEKKYTTFEEKILKSSIKQPVKSNIIGGGTAFVNKTEFQKLIIPFAKYLDADIVISKELYEKDNNWEYKTVGAPEGFIKSNAYFAVGINGHDNHLNAVTESKLIIAINDDPNSPIFKNADIGIIADIKKFIPVFTEILRRRNI